MNAPLERSEVITEPRVFQPEPGYRLSSPRVPDLEVIVRPDPVDRLEVIHHPDEPSSRLPQVVVAAGCAVTLLSGLSAVALH